MKFQRKYSIVTSSNSVIPAAENIIELIEVVNTVGTTLNSGDVKKIKNDEVMISVSSGDGSGETQWR